MFISLEYKFGWNQEKIFDSLNRTVCYLKAAVGVTKDGHDDNYIQMGNGILSHIFLSKDTC